MSLPVMHTFAGYSTYRLARKGGIISSLPLLALCLLAGNLPDFDFLPGVILGEAAFFHRGHSHSIGACLIFAALVSVVWSRWRPQEKDAAVRLATAAYGSHLILDYFNTSPKGTMLLWPLTDSAIYSPFMRPEHFTQVSALDSAGGLTDLVMAFTTGPLMRAVFHECLLVAAISMIWLLAGRLAGLAGKAADRLALARLVPALVFLSFYFGI